MNTSRLDNTDLLSLGLLLPAALLCGAGSLYLFFGLDSANRWLEAVTANPAGKVLLSPWVVLGGVLAAGALSVVRLFHVSAEVIDQELVVAIAIKRLWTRLLCLAGASVLLVCLLTYVFVENFRIVAR